MRCPVLREETTAPNPLVVDMYRERLRLGRPLILTTLDAADIRKWIDSDGIVVMNVDTSYPGTRHTRPLPFLDGRLTILVGLLSFAVRRSFDVRAVAAPGAAGQVSVAVSSPLPGDIEEVLCGLGAFFERWTAECPERWMAWGSLEEGPDRHRKPGSCLSAVYEARSEHRSAHGLSHES